MHAGIGPNNQSVWLKYLADNLERRSRTRFLLHNEIGADEDRTVGERVVIVSKFFDHIGDRPPDVGHRRPVSGPRARCYKQRQCK